MPSTDGAGWPAIVEALAVVAATGLAFVSIRQQSRNEDARRKAVDGRISAQAYAARRTILSWLEDPTRPKISPSDEEARFVAEKSVHFPTVEARLERMAADAPEATPVVGQAVRDAVVLFYDATARVYREIHRADKLGERDDWEFREALGELKASLDPLTRAIDPGLRDK